MKTGFHVPRAYQWTAHALAALALALGGPAGFAADPLPTQYIVPGSDTIPEGTTIDEVRDEIYTTSVTRGTIFRGRLTDTRLTEFLPPGKDGRIQTLGINVDAARNRLFICGGGTGLAFVYDTRNGQLLGKFKTDVAPTSGGTGTVHDIFVSSNTLVNDVAITPNGDAYFTDSIRPILFRLPASQLGQPNTTLTLETWRDFTGTVLSYPIPDPNDFLTSVNANGITVTADGQYFIIVQTNTGKLFRVTIADKSVIEINAGSARPAPVGAGLAMSGNTLYIVSPVMPIKRFTLSADFASATEVPLVNPPTFNNASAAALAGGRLYVVNAQILTFIGGTSTAPPFIISVHTPP